MPLGVNDVKGIDDLSKCRGEFGADVDLVRVGTAGGGER